MTDRSSPPAQRRENPQPALDRAAFIAAPHQADRRRLYPAGLSTLVLLIGLGMIGLSVIAIVGAPQLSPFRRPNENYLVWPFLGVAAVVVLVGLYLMFARQTTLVREDTGATWYSRSLLGLDRTRTVFTSPRRTLADLPAPALTHPPSLAALRVIWPGESSLLDAESLALIAPVDEDLTTLDVRAAFMLTASLVALSAAGAVTLWEEETYYADGWPGLRRRRFTASADYLVLFGADEADSLPLGQPARRMYGAIQAWQAQKGNRMKLTPELSVDALVTAQFELPQRRPSEWLVRQVTDAASRERLFRYTSRPLLEGAFLPDAALEADARAVIALLERAAAADPAALAGLMRRILAALRQPQGDDDVFPRIWTRR